MAVAAEAEAAAWFGMGKPQLEAKLRAANAKLTWSEQLLQRQCETILQLTAALNAANTKAKNGLHALAATAASVGGAAIAAASEKVAALHM